MIIVNVNAGSCRYGRIACAMSCVSQNCATGYCPNGDDGICVCSRCEKGPWKPPMPGK